ncbi:hypothetical protein MK805_09690 [Shimazuella sp. AN120528]|nr:hypothetical protein [Shimazuella soli]
MLFSKQRSSQKNVSVGQDPKSLNVDFSGSNVQSDFPIQQGTISTSTNEVDNRQLKGVIGTSDANT